jgi:hypothetical protein
MQPPMDTVEVEAAFLPAHFAAGGNDREGVAAVGVGARPGDGGVGHGVGRAAADEAEPIPGSTPKGGVVVDAGDVDADEVGGPADGLAAGAEGAD